MLHKTIPSATYPVANILISYIKSVKTDLYSKVYEWFTVYWFHILMFYDGLSVGLFHFFFEIKNGIVHYLWGIGRPWCPRYVIKERRNKPNYHMMIYLITTTKITNIHNISRHCISAGLHNVIQCKCDLKMKTPILCFIDQLSGKLRFIEDVDFKFFRFFWTNTHDILKI